MNRYKSHPAILLWGFGNEKNFYAPRLGDAVVAEAVVAEADGQFGFVAEERKFQIVREEA